MRRRSVSQVEEGAGYWPSFADIMSFVVLVLLFVLVTAFIQAAVSIQNRIEGKRAIVDIMNKRLALTRELQGELGRDAVELSPEGNLTLRGDVLFKPDLPDLQDTAGVDVLLTRLAHNIANVLEQARFREGLLMILVEGHTAQDGKPPDTHWNLSAERAVRIIEALQVKDARLRRPELARYLGVGGRAFYNPADLGNSELALSHNRRVEIRLVLKDEGLRDALLEALSR